VLVPDGPCASDLGLGIADQEGLRAIPFDKERVGATWVYRSAGPPFEAEQAYTLVVLSEGDPFPVGFTTGSRPYQPPPLSLTLGGTELVDPGDGIVAPMAVHATSAAGNLLHFTGAAEPTDPWFATLSDGDESYRIVNAQIIDDEACVAVRAASASGALTPWVQSCQAVEETVPPVDTGDPPEEEETALPIDTGYWDEGYYLDGYYYGSNNEFVLFGCGGCQSGGGPSTALLLPLALLPWMRRRR
jgi:hypothetical protein